MAEQAASRTSLRQLPIGTVAAGILAIVAAVSLVQRIHSVRHRYDDVDFIFYYGWWTDYSTGGDPFVVQSKPTELRPGVMRPRYCNNTPFFVELFSPLSRFDQITAFWIWQASQILCLVAAVLMLARANAPPFNAASTIIVLSLLLLSRQFSGTLAGAEVTPTLLMLLSASWFCWRRDRPAAAGVCLALAALVKLYPVTAGGYFLFARRWRALGWAIASFVAGVLLTKPAHWIELTMLEMPVSYRNVARAELTVLAAVRRVVAHFAGTTIAAAPMSRVIAITAIFDLALLAIAAAATIRSIRRPDLDGLLFGLWVTLALLMSPLAWLPETLLLLPMYLFGVLAAWSGFQRRDASPRKALIAGSVILVACITTALIKAVPHPGFPMLLAAYLGGALIFYARLQSEP